MLVWEKLSREVETKGNLLKQAQEYLASIQNQGEQRRLEQQRAQLAHQQNQEQLKEIQELLEALQSELATDATQSLSKKSWVPYWAIGRNWASKRKLEPRYWNHEVG